MAEIGKRNRLRVTRETLHGVYLDAGELGEILLPRGLVPPSIVPGDEVDVFIHHDSEDRLVATTETPFACVGEVATMEVIDVNPRVGAFLNWGLQKDLLLPHREQSGRLHAGDRVVVYVMRDPRSDRIIATTRFEDHLPLVPHELKRGQPVSLLIARDTPLGFVCLVERTQLGLLYRQLITRPLSVGDEVTGYIHDIRDDGRIDLTMESSSRHRVEELTTQILDEIKRRGGELRMNDDTPPEVIRNTFGASKRAFKQAIGALLKQRLIRFTERGVALK